MAVDVPQGDVAVATPPKRPGTEMGQTVRHEGYVWEWDSSARRTGWRKVRVVNEEDRRIVPPANVALDEGFDYDEWRKVESDVPDSRVKRDTSNPGTSGGGGGGGDGRGGQALNGIPDGGVIWQVGDDYYVVYDVPNADGDTRLAYRFRDKAEANAVSGGKGIDVARTLSTQEFAKSGAIPSGNADLIVNTSEHPFAQWNRDFAKEAQFKPWLRDPDMLAVVAGAILENRQPTMAEIQSTDWYQSHTATERQMLELFYGDREEWQAQRVDAEDKARGALTAAGYAGGGAGRVADYLSRELMFGRIRDGDALTREVERLSNPLAQGAVRSAGFDAPKQGRAVEVDGEVFWRVGHGDKARDYRMSEVEQAKYGKGAVEKQNVQGGGGEGRSGFAGVLRQGGGRDLSAVDNTETVRNLVRTWLGPQLMQGWGERKIAEWGQRFTEEGQEAQDELTAKLRGIRSARYQGYEPDLTYEDIASIGRAQVMQEWGTRIDETDPVFHRILQMNDEAKAAQLLWKEGLDRGVEKVTQTALAGLSQQMDGGVRRSMV